MDYFLPFLSVQTYQRQTTVQRYRGSRFLWRSAWLKCIKPNPIVPLKSELSSKLCHLSYGWSTGRLGPQAKILL